MSVTQDSIPLSGLPESERNTLAGMLKYQFNGSVIELEEEILTTYSAYEGRSDDFLSTGQRIAFAAGWLIKSNGRYLIPMFSRNAEMYIGNKYLLTPDIPVAMSDIDVLTASRVIFPNGDYTPGGKIVKFRENQNFRELEVTFSLGNNIAFEFNHELQEVCYMPVGIMVFDEPEKWFIKTLEEDPNVLFISPDEIVGAKEKLPLTAKAEIFLDMANAYINGK